MNKSHDARIEAASPFAERVAYYDRYRQGYPESLIVILGANCGLKDSWEVADVGSGTGLLAERFLNNGNPVFGVEPNTEMRRVAERRLGIHPQFRSVCGSAEATTLAEQSIDLIGVGRALHWFDLDRAFVEFRRILKRDGWVAVVRLRRRRQSAFEADYHNLLCSHGKDYTAMHRRRTEIEHDLVSRGFAAHTEQGERDLSLESLVGLTRSLTITPAPDEDGHTDMMSALADLFRRYEEAGLVSLTYDLVVHYCRIDRMGVSDGKKRSKFSRPSR